VKCVVTRVPLIALAIGCSGPESKGPSSPDSGSGTSQDTDVSEGGGSGGEDPVDTGEAGDTGELPLAVYCEDNVPELSNCDPDRHYDPWTSQVRQVSYWIRDQKTESFPFTVIYDPDIWYGYIRMSSSEVLRDFNTEDVFHIWFSETPNGPLLNGSSKCEQYERSAEFDFFWYQHEDDAALQQMCFIGTEERVLYLNYETRCSPGHYEGLCDDLNKQKSVSPYQFDVARWRIVLD